MAAIPFKGPIAKAEVATVEALDADGASFDLEGLAKAIATVDDIMEEALEFPKEAEATANIADGTPEQSSVSLPFALPVLIGSPFHAAIAPFVTGRQRVRVRITTADGPAKTYGGTRGLRVRKLIDDNLAPDALPVEIYMFHGVYGKSGDGIGAVEAAA